MRRLALFLVALLALIGAPLAAQPQFPELTGRVVDQADILTPEAEAALTAKLEARGLLERLQLTGRSQELVLTAIGKRMLAKVRASITAHETETMARVPEDLRAHVIPILTALWGPESDAD